MTSKGLSHHYLAAAVLFLLQSRKRGHDNPGQDGLLHVTLRHDRHYGVEGPHLFLEEATLDVWWVKARWACSIVRREGEEDVTDQGETRRGEGDRCHWEEL